MLVEFRDHSTTVLLGCDGIVSRVILLGGRGLGFTPLTEPQAPTTGIERRRRSKLTPSMELSCGQLRLRELVGEVASGLDPTSSWKEPPALEMLADLRRQALGEPVIVEDERTGRDMAIPAIPATYLALHELLYPARKVSSVTVNVEHLLCTKGTVYDPPSAVAGGRKWHVTYGALTHFALGRTMQIGDESAPTIFSGSSVIAMGGGSNHRTLASFLWGYARLEHDRGLITIIDDQLDPVLRRACEALEKACSRDVLRLGIYIPYDHDRAAELRQRVLELGGMAEHDARFARALEKRAQRPPPKAGRDMVKLEEVEQLALTKPPWFTRLRRDGVGR